MNDIPAILDLQSCTRRFLLNHEWRPLRWRPKRLLDACFRQAIIDISNKTASRAARVDARTRFMQASANPGLEVTKGTPYNVALEWVALLDVLVTSIPYLKVPRELHEGPVVKLDSLLDWKISAQVDNDERLHRFITVDSWTPDDMQRELDSWWVAGDVAAAGKPMTLHVIEIGQMREGKFSSPWVRAWRHPAVNKIHFCKQDGSPLRGWRPVRLVDHPTTIDVDDWTDKLWREGATREMVHTVGQEPLGDELRAKVIDDLFTEVARGKALKGTKWSKQPMSRGACHNLVPCPFIPVCYCEHLASVESLGLYQRRKEPHTVAREAPTNVHTASAR